MERNHATTTEDALTPSRADVEDHRREHTTTPTPTPWGRVIATDAHRARCVACGAPADIWMPMMGESICRPCHDADPEEDILDIRWVGYMNDLEKVREVLAGVRQFLLDLGEDVIASGGPPRPDDARIALGWLEVACADLREIRDTLGWADEEVGA